MPRSVAVTARVSTKPYRVVALYALVASSRIAPGASAPLPRSKSRTAGTVGAVGRLLTAAADGTDSPAASIACTR